MEAIFIGTTAALFVLGIFFLGTAFGSKVAGRNRAEDTPVEPSEEEKRRLQEDQRAFESLLHYNIDVVYGCSTTDETEEDV